MKEITRIPDTIDSVEQYEELARSLEKDVEVSDQLQNQLYARNRMINVNKSLLLQNAKHLCNHTNLAGSTMQRTEGFKSNSLDWYDPKDDYSWECKICGSWWYAPEEGSNQFTEKHWQN